ncbi:hypothetical protein TEQG_04207 [Trichophyton equinum CBS 127.97]|uniref:Uncharacterized protein n=1 Tax=Trichophyton equinum (strain ATCC MYA-4606 / CBS 127.97) TaxID=559882 RepID=F2PTV9_TRIEC|nr:hypothetical protein TEQG_04207 [Trichophyton equinum CBS 127.97]
MPLTMFLYVKGKKLQDRAVALRLRLGTNNNYYHCWSFVQTEQDAGDPGTYVGKTIIPKPPASRWQPRRQAFLLVTLIPNYLPLLSKKALSGSWAIAENIMDAHP